MCRFCDMKKEEICEKEKLLQMRLDRAAKEENQGRNDLAAQVWKMAERYEQEIALLKNSPCLFCGKR